jgi:hypothetical protein
LSEMKSFDRDMAPVAGRLCLGEALARIAPGDLDLIGQAGKAFIDFCRPNGISALALRALKLAGQEACMTPRARELLRCDAIRSAGRNIGLLADLAELAAAFGKAGLAPVALKGPALIGRIYDDPALRPITDLDLLVDRAEPGGIRDSLVDLGYTQTAAYANLYCRGATVIDLHEDVAGSARISGRAGAIDLPTCGLLRLSVPLDRYATLRRLAPLDEILVLSYHLVKHGFGRLIWLVDLARCLDALGDTHGPGRLAIRAQEAGMAPLLAFSLAVLRERLGWEDNREMARVFPRRPIRPLDRYLLNISGRPDAPQILEPVLLAGNIDNTGLRWRYLLETAFPRPTVMRQVVGGRSTRPRFASILARTAQLAWMGSRALTHR